MKVCLFSISIYVCIYIRIRVLGNGSIVVRSPDLKWETYPYPEELLCLDLMPKGDQDFSLTLMELGCGDLELEQHYDEMERSNNIRVSQSP
jgi:hypothetical protein